MNFKEALEEIIRDHQKKISPEIDSNVVMFFQKERTYTPSFITSQKESLPDYTKSVLEQTIPELLYIAIARNEKVIAPGIFSLTEQEVNSSPITTTQEEILANSC